MNTFTPTSPSTVALLHGIPSETTPGERNLLYRLFRETWSGIGHVVEIGPFLGGTTRAIALGMMANPNRSPAARLHTFDRFGDYYTPADLKRMLQPLVINGTFSEAKAAELSDAGDFLGIFQALHQPHPYAALIEAHNSPLPDFPEELKTSRALDKLLDQGPFGALFIDGCKSWASTLFAMKFLLPRTTPHARLIFQDFGWYTCFWISSFVYSLRDLLVAHERVDATYVFSLNRPVTEADIEKRFAPTPDAMGAQFFKDACLNLMKESIARKDVRGALIAQLHFVAALATIGRKADALNLLNTINPKDYGGLASLIAGSRKSPTYRPGNKPILWTE